MRVRTPFLKSLNVTVTVIRGGDWDYRGQEIPEERIEVDQCRVGWRSTADPVDRSDLTRSTGVLYRRPPFEFHSSDHIEIPAGHPLAGVWAVDGRPQVWHSGVEVPLRQE